MEMVLEIQNSPILLDMVMVSSTGQMELNMRVNGNIIKLTAKEPSIMLKETFMWENLKMIWLMGEVSIPILMALSIRVTLEMMFKRVKEKKSGWMVPSMLVDMRME